MADELGKASVEQVPRTESNSGPDIQTGDLEAEIANNLKIIRDGLGVHKGARLSPEVLQARHNQISRATLRLRQIAEERNPAVARSVDWNAFLYTSNDMVPPVYLYTRARHAGRFNPGGLRDDSFFGDNAEGYRNASPEGLAAEEFGQPYPKKRGRSGYYVRDAQSSQSQDIYDDAAVRREGQLHKMEALFKPIIMRDRVNAGKPPRNDEEAKAHREAAARKALEAALDAGDRARRDDRFNRARRDDRLAREAAEASDTGLLDINTTQVP